MFLDESGFLMAPVVRRTWAPIGQTPYLFQRTRYHHKVSAIAALSLAPRRRRVGLYFALYPDPNRPADLIIRFLRHLRRQLQCPIVLVWDRLGAHRGAAMRRFLARARSFHSEFLPPYCPELDPVELVWAYLKTTALANDAPADVAEVHRHAARSLHRLRRRYDLLRCFLTGPALSLFSPR